MTGTEAVPTATVEFTDVMSCSGRVIVVGDRATVLADDATTRLRRLEGLWSRFLPDSDISRLNAAEGTPVAVAVETITLAQVLIDAVALTDGAFDPTLLRTLVELGYGASRTRPERHTHLPPAASRRGGVDAIRVDSARGAVTLPPGMALDAGGLGKGLAADLVVAELMDAGAVGCLVEIGGDLRVAGEAPGGYAWTIATEGDDEGVLRLAGGGVATSSTERRTWNSGGQRHHHLLDPTTGRPADTGVTQCTVAAGSAVIAEALTKVAVVRGLHNGIGFYADRGIAARITTDDGTVVTTPAWRELRGDLR